MIDFAKISARAGDGGSGSGSFEHIFGKRRGKADGGDGGRGGNIYFEATGDLNTLEPFRFEKNYQAETGGNGLSRRRKGANGRDLVIKVPQGTQASSQFQIYDLVEAGQKVLIARGGQGGRGNCHLRDEFGRRPFRGEVGERGEEIEIILELKLIAQVGLIGLPNVGKSTLLSRLTSARPKVAAYPFTTLEPNLGVIKVKVKSQSMKSKGEKSLYTADFDSQIVIADIPGLIEGASKGKGLGDLFLRHVERTGVLVHLVDASSLDPLANYQTVRQELKAYSTELFKKREIVAVNKIDLASGAVIDKIKSTFIAKRKKVYLISAETGEGVSSLVKEILKRVD